MSAQESPCFYESANAILDGKISLEEHTRNALRHLFSGTRHAPYDDEIGEERVNYWLGRDALSAAVHVCLLQRDFKFPFRGGEEDPDVERTLVDMLVSIKGASSLTALQGVNDSKCCAAILDVPLLYQLLVCVALENGNRNLVRDMIAHAEPGPSFHLLFSPAAEPTGHVFRGFHETVTVGVDGRGDSGCKLYAGLIKAGWALPRNYMYRWAATSPDVEAGIQLVNTLVEDGVEIDELALCSAAGSGEIAMLEYLLSISKPAEAEKRHKLLRSAAIRKVNGASCLQVLYDHGIVNINWMSALPTEPLNPRDQQEMDSPFETPLHAAAMHGEPEAVDWLLRHGAKRLRDYHGQDQVWAAKAFNREDNLLVFQRYSGWELKREREREKSRCHVM